MSSYDRELAHLLRTNQIEEFNSLRPQEKERGAEVNLSRIDLSNKSLANANLNKIVLRNANFSGANLIDTLLKGADLADAVFDGALMIGTNLSEAHVSGVDFTKAGFISGINIWGMCSLNQGQQSFLSKKIKESWNSHNGNKRPAHISVSLAKLLRERFKNCAQN